jgi:hypothetical protein
MINLPILYFPARQGAGASQINHNTIVIFGGFSKGYLSDVYFFNHKTATIERKNDAP